jgi:hypothetical protein
MFIYNFDDCDENGAVNPLTDKYNAALARDVVNQLRINFSSRFPSAESMGYN